MRIVFLLLFCNTLFAYMNPIKKSILILHPKFDKKLALQYSNIIYRGVKRYKFDPFLVVAIAMQESTFILNQTTGRMKEEIIYDKSIRKYIMRYEVHDMCLMQINYTNVRALKLDPNRLLNDPEYCISEALKILYIFKKGYAHKDKLWWTRYNARDPLKRLEYATHILRRYNKIKKKVNFNSKSLRKYKPHLIEVSNLDEYFKKMGFKFNLK